MFKYLWEIKLDQSPKSDKDDSQNPTQIPNLYCQRLLLPIRAIEI